jgi:CheY-like chemotaxis protein
MRVLVLDPDERFAALVADRLVDDDHEVTCADNPGQVAAMLRARPADVVLVDLSRRRMNGFDVARALREEHGPDLDLVLVSPVHEDGDDEVEELVRAVDARAFFSRPVDLDALAEELLRPRTSRAPLAPEPAPVETAPPEPRARPTPLPAPCAAKKPRPEVSWSNARMLMKLWYERSTGTLLIEHSGKTGEALIREGGLLDPTALPLIDRALQGADVSFQEGVVDGVGDWTLFGNQVFIRCRAACDASTMLGYMNATPVPADQIEMARALAITGPTRRLMGMIDGESDLQGLLDQCQAAPSEVSSDLQVLVQLGLLTLHRGDESVPVRAEGLVDVEITEGEARALRDARESSDLDGLPAIDHEVILGAHSQEGPEAIEARLARELETVEDALPPVVLGVPGDASTALVDEVASRMRDRYAQLAQDPHQTDRTHELAAQIGRIIADAHRHFHFHDHTQTGSSEVGERGSEQADRVAVLLEQGRQFIARGEWSAADSVLTKAHRSQLDHPDVLANLGWARLHNPGRDEERRTDEGRDFLLLGEQFDPENPDGQYFLAQFLLASNMLEAAVERARRAKEAAPGEPARSALYRKIQIKLAAEEG